MMKLFLNISKVTFYDIKLIPIKRKRRFITLSFLIGFLWFAPSTLFSQNTKIDSLNILITQSESDTTKVQLMLDLSKEFFGSDSKRAISISKEAKALSESIDFKSGIAYSLKNIGLGHYYLSDYAQALSYWQKAKSVFEDINDVVGVSNMLSNMGAVYFDQGANAKAIELSLQSLKLAEEAKDTLRIGTALQNIGVIQLASNEYELGLDALMRTLPLFELINYDIGIGLGSLKIGEYYLKIDDYEAALIYLQKSLEYLKNTTYYSDVLVLLGIVYQKKGGVETGLKYLNLAYEEALKSENYKLGAMALNALGITHEENGDLKLAMELYEKAKASALKLSNSNPELVDAYSGLMRIYFIQGNSNKGYEYQNLHQAVKDSMYNIESIQAQNRLLFNYEIEKKEVAIALLEKDNEIQKAKEEKQKLIRNGFIFGFLVLLVFASVFFIQRNKIKKGKKLSDKLLHNILPEEVAEELKEKGESVAKDFEDVTVLFSDFKEFTSISENLSAQELVAEINICFKAFDNIITSYGMEKIKTIGDSYMAAGGLHIPRTSTTKDVVMAGLEMRDFIRKRKNELEDQKKAFFEMRIGIHTGPVVAGIVGEKKFQYDIWGNTVNTASRMESNGEIDKVNISQYTYGLIKDDSLFAFEKRGKIQVKGKGEMEMYFVSLKNVA